MQVLNGAWCIGVLAVRKFSDISFLRGKATDGRHIAAG